MSKSFSEVTASNLTKFVRDVAIFNALLTCSLTFPIFQSVSELQRYNNFTFSLLRCDIAQYWVGTFSGRRRRIRCSYV